MFPKLNKLFFLVSLIHLSIFANQNAFGTKGTLFTPSAYFNEVGSLSMGYSRTESFSRANLLAQPYDWLEFSLFYSDIPELSWSASLGQSYKDKGFNAKFLLKQETDLLPQVAIGFSDFVGTGLFSGEYIVFSKKNKSIEFSMGMGWGIYSRGITINNPLSAIDDRFDSRNDLYDSTIGEFDFDDYFSGNEAAIFSSLSYSNQNHKFSLEISPIEFKGRGQLENKLSRYYLGYSYKFDKNLENSLFVGDRGDLVFSINFTDSFANRQNNSYKKPTRKTDKRLANLVISLQENDISLKNLYIDKKNRLNIGIRQNSYLDRRKSVSNTVASLDYADMDSFEEIVITNYLFGQKVTDDYVTKSVQGEEYIKKTSRDEEILIFENNESFPRSTFNFSPSLRTMLAAREGFLHQGLFLDSFFKHYFAENLFIDSKLTYSLADNFDDLILEPVTTYPNLVRSDIKKYLQSIGDKVSIERLEVNYLNKSGDNHYLFKAGIFELMFAGYGMEYLKINRFKNIGYGFEAYEVKKREYSVDFDLMDYKTITGHLNLYHYFDPLNMTTHISWGKYLAGDKGYTVDVSRRFANGLKFGFYFSLTDVTFEQFGEGSFDKGIYFQLPIKSIYGKPYTGFTWSPLTKDPAQKLLVSNRLFGLLDRYIY